MEDWTKLYETTELLNANVVNAALHAENIDTALINKKDSAYVFLGIYEILVRKEDVTKAEEILDQIEDREEEYAEKEN